MQIPTSTKDYDSNNAAESRKHTKLQIKQIPPAHQLELGFSLGWKRIVSVSRLSAPQDKQYNTMPKTTTA